MSNAATENAPSYSPEDLNLASVQEQKALSKAQMDFLMERVVALRAEINRLESVANQLNVQLTGANEENARLQAELSNLAPQEPPASEQVVQGDVVTQ